ncbi:hypothetical protein HMPREF9129_0427 [Peptoniphilus indolicus ATCC 29427]|uniref:Uncharacterized protein n=1 Tax=Peptoniphilus indolicus ATCC 29427 TaxID=997350 RepID=G4D1Z7_9FIRM|nr:hypothetical protein HMPREF9129_0427 [Peptoniphilus indolicus ATCC 29427]
MKKQKNPRQGIETIIKFSFKAYFIPFSRSSEFYLSAFVCVCYCVYLFRLLNL